ncbi:hypothetical protein SEA_GODPOWER_14 [Streptomyces phage Godpower]|uniref:Uncharacterized protein n=3 Tax=Likavirus TaxID=1982880 RepID=R4TI55_9CAUD|nr:tail completion or Neck1 protein [Streptomyces phage Lika]YP_008051416.1 tail completion or Neck1 protein [Streptomyces phage Sujidade]AGM12036.1 hypothetical protein LIKA_13 [Streptomyces phage Lika]AGM12112.1 hypothetical protein SUJIDADE_14 [Streptomyces phage Sujidade]AOQ26990.1 hypothetical protein SEA_GODPOWER_14 [Streptomyces phage Godpower]
MAKIYSRVGGRDLEQFIALNDVVQDELDNRTFEIAVRAEGYLAETRLDKSNGGDSFIDVERGKVDRYVVLSDERGQNAALSIEYGRAAGEYETKDKKTGETITVQYGEMEGLYILARASNLPKKRKGKVQLD